METSPNFTPKSQQVISDAKFLADERMHEEVTCGHLLVSILSSEYSFINELIRGFDLNVDEFIDFIEDFYLIKDYGDCKFESFYNEDLKDILSKSHSFAKKKRISAIHRNATFYHLPANRRAVAKSGLRGNRAGLTGLSGSPVENDVGDTLPCRYPQIWLAAKRLFTCG